MIRKKYIRGKQDAFFTLGAILSHNSNFEESVYHITLFEEV
jgi:hypothetical protein